MGGMALTFLALPLIARLYTPAEMGTSQQVIAFCGALGAMTALSLERVLYTDLTPARRKALGALIPLVVVAVAFVALPLFQLTAMLLPAMPMAVAGVPVVLFVFTFLIARGLYLALYTYAVTDRQLRQATVSILGRDVSRIAARLGFGALGWGTLGLLVAAVLDWIVGLAILRSGVRFPWAATLRLNARRIGKLLAHYRQFPLFFAPSMALCALVPQIPVFLLGSLISVEAAGVYAIAYLLIDRPGVVIAKAGSDVFSVSARDSLMDRPDRARSLWSLLRGMCLMSAIHLPIVLAVATAMIFLAEPMLGTNWRDVGHFGLVLAPHLSAVFLSELSHGLYAYENGQRYLMLRQIVAGTAIIVSFNTASMVGFDLFWTLGLAGLTHLTVQIMALYLLWRRLSKS